MKRFFILFLLCSIALSSCKGEDKPDTEEPKGEYIAGTPPGDVRQWIHKADAPAVIVPDDFIGMHMHRWPNLTRWEIDNGRKPSPKPSFDYGLRRIWGYAEDATWRTIDVGYNTIETTERRDWAMLDEVIDAEVKLGRKVMMTINTTPTALSSNPTAPGKFPGWPGHQYAPKDEAAFDKLRKFVADLVARYGNKLAYIDTNNEPDPENPIPEKDNFWVGTKEQHAEWHRMQRLAVPRGSNGPLLIGPSSAVWDWQQDKAHNYTLSVLVAKDTKGTRLIDHLDAFACHYYEWPTADVFHYWQAITAVKATLKAAGKEGMPIYDTEHGALDQTEWNNNSRELMAKQVLRHSLIAAGSGLKLIAWYAGDGTNLAFAGLEGGVIANALQKIQEDLPGLEVREAAILKDGRCWIRGMKNNKITEFIY